MSAGTMLFYTQLISGVWFDEKDEAPKSATDLQTDIGF